MVNKKMVNTNIAIEKSLEPASSIFVHSLETAREPSTRNEILAWLEINKSTGLLSELEFQFSAFIARQEILALENGDAAKSQSSNQASINLMTLLSVFVIRQFNAQSTCFEINNCQLDSFDNRIEISLPPQSEWLDCIKDAKCTEENGPLTFYNGFLFLTRNYINEKNLADYLTVQSHITPALSWNVATSDNSGIQSDDSAVSDILAQLFLPLDKSAPNGPDYDWQKHAVFNSLNHRFSVITGGPGTGKTTTVIKLLAATIHLYELQAAFVKQRFGQLKIALAAPTGKAALRLTESISGNVKSLEGVAPNIKSQIPTEAMTLHRLLKLAAQAFFIIKIINCHWTS